MDFDYELRHPGHGDQSVHNPHKGGGYQIGSDKSATVEQAADRIRANKQAFEQGGGEIVLNPSKQEMDDARESIYQMKREYIASIQPPRELTAKEKDVVDGMGYANTAIATKQMQDRNNSIVPTARRPTAPEQEYDQLAIAYTKGPNGERVVAGAVLFDPAGPHKAYNRTDAIYLGSTGAAKGAGSSLMFTVMNESVRTQSEFRVKEPVGGALPFYRSMGLDYEGGRTPVMIFTRSTKVDDIVKLVNKP